MIRKLWILRSQTCDDTVAEWVFSLWQAFLHIGKQATIMNCCTCEERLPPEERCFCPGTTPNLTTIHIVCYSHITFPSLAAEWSDWFRLFNTDGLSIPLPCPSAPYDHILLRSLALPARKGFSFPMNCFFCDMGEAGLSWHRPKAEFQQRKTDSPSFIHLYLLDWTFSEPDPTSSIRWMASTNHTNIQYYVLYCCSSQYYRRCTERSCDQDLDTESLNDLHVSGKEAGVAQAWVGLHGLYWIKLMRKIELYRFNNRFSCEM